MIPQGSISSQDHSDAALAGMRDLEMFRSASDAPKGPASAAEIQSTDSEQKLKNTFSSFFTEECCISERALKYFGVLIGLVVVQVAAGFFLSTVSTKVAKEFSKETPAPKAKVEHDPKRPYASPTVSKGFSVILEIPELQEVCDYVAKTYGLRRTPAGPFFLFEMSLPTAESVRTDFKRLVTKLKRMHLKELVYTPLQLEVSRSAIWDHNYADLLFRPCETTTKLYEEASMIFSTFNNRHRDGHDSADRCTIGTASLDLKDWHENPEKIKHDLMSRFPNLLRNKLHVARISLWNTNGTTDQWVRLDSVDLCELN